MTSDAPFAKVLRVPVSDEPVLYSVKYVACSAVVSGRR